RWLSPVPGGAHGRCSGIRGLHLPNSAQSHSPLECRRVRLRHSGNSSRYCANAEVVVLTNSGEQRSIVLIGPTGVGKSAVGRDLAALLDWDFVELDELRSEWYPEFGLDPEAERMAMEQGGLPELVAAWKPYELMSV